MISIVVPCYNEEEAIPFFYPELKKYLDEIPETYEILFVDDGKLAAVGNHDTLYETCPAYRKMVDLQRLEEEGGAVHG